MAAKPYTTMAMPPTFFLSANSSSTAPRLDEMIKVQFERCRQSGVLRNDPLESSVLRKGIPGKLRLIAEYEPSLFGKKRPATVSKTSNVISMNQPFDANKFNFSKVGAEEVMVLIDSGEEEGGHPILANVSPLMYGHGLLTPWVKQELPQQLTPDAVSLAIRLILAATDCEFCIGFNSLGAFSSVNHLHLHILYPGELDHDARLDGKEPLMDGRKDFPITNAPIKETITKSYGGCQVDLLDWMVPCFSFQSRLEDIRDAFTKLQSAVAHFVRFLHHQQTPHNVLFVRDPASRIRAVVIPRKPQHFFDASKHGFNAALGEISGMLIAKTQQHFESFDQIKILQAMQEFVACDDTVLSQILQVFRDGVVPVE